MVSPGVVSFDLFRLHGHLPDARAGRAARAARGGGAGAGGPAAGEGVQQDTKQTLVALSNGRKTIIWYHED